MLLFVLCKIHFHKCNILWPQSETPDFACLHLGFFSLSFLHSFFLSCILACLLCLFFIFVFYLNSLSCACVLILDLECPCSCGSVYACVYACVCNPLMYGCVFSVNNVCSAFPLEPYQFAFACGGDLCVCVCVCVCECVSWMEMFNVSKLKCLEEICYT